MIDFRIVRVGVLAGVISAPASAQTPTPTFQTDVVVTAERASEDRQKLPAATAVLSAEELRVRPGGTLADAVQFLPGFHVLSADGFSLAPASIARGFFGAGEAEYVRVLVDGVPINDVESGAVDWRQIPAAAIERVEALRGPASALYGDAALAGIVQIFTTPPVSRSGRISAGGGSFESAMASVNVSQPVVNRLAHFAASHRRSSGSRIHSAARETFASAQLQNGGGTPRWTGRASLALADREDPGALSAQQILKDERQSDSLFRFDRDDQQRWHALGRYENSRDRYSFAGSAYLSAKSGDRVRTLLLAPDIADRASRELTTRTAGFGLENAVDMTGATLSSRLRFGADLSRAVLDTTYADVSTAGEPQATSAAAVANRWQYAAYATHSMDLGDRATLLAGIRWDAVHDSTAGYRDIEYSWSPRLGGSVVLPASAVAFAQVAGAFKMPTLDQRFDPRPFPDFRGGTFTISSAALRPQRAINAEAGVRQSWRRFEWQGLAYRQRVSDEIDFDPGTFTYANIGRSVHEGVEIDATMWRGSAASIGFDYSWTRVRPRERGVVRQLKNIPRHLLRPHLTLLLPANVSIHTRYIRTSGAYADDANQFPLSDRSTIDMRITKSWRRWTGHVDVMNLTGDRYEEVGYVLQDFSGRLVPYYYPASRISAKAALDVRF